MKLSRYLWPASTVVLLLVSLVLSAALYRTVNQKTFRDTNLSLLNPQVVAFKAPTILSDTGARVVVLWATDLNVNARTVMYAHDTRGPVDTLVGYTDRVYTDSALINTFMAQLMTAKLKCGQINTTSKVGQYVASVGAPSICRRGIMKEGVLLGYISLSFAETPPDAKVVELDRYLDSVIDAVERRN